MHTFQIGMHVCMPVDLLRHAIVERASECAHDCPIDTDSVAYELLYDVSARFHALVNKSYRASGYQNAVVNTIRSMVSVRLL